MSGFYSECERHKRVSGGRLSKTDAMRIGKRHGIPADELPEVWDEENCGVIGGSSQHSADWIDGRQRYLD
jgi:hypothetical protein